jgi:integrase/recombinase XerD
MNAEAVRWSDEKQKHLQEPLVGFFASDEWTVGPPDKPHRRCTLRFPLLSSSLKTEVKYAVWHKFEQKEWRMDASGHYVKTVWLASIIEWLNTVAPNSLSLIERSEASWELSLRSWLSETHRLKPTTVKHVSAKQTIVEYAKEDGSIRLFRQVYRSVAEAYDDRGEAEKDVWDLRILGLAVNPTQTQHLLNFTLISQPWLRQLAKEFMRYNMAVHSPGDCVAKLQTLRIFSQFLTRHHPRCSMHTINRALIVAFISYVQQLKGGVGWKNHVLVNLRTILETCAYHLNMQALSKERLIVDEDLAKKPKATPRDIPDEVLEQLREHLDSLPTTTLRMVTILLECGMRIGELCAMSLDCLICDDKHEWYLRFYQMKGKQEHVIPLVDKTVIGTIQAQQEEIRAVWGQTCPYLFPSPQSPLRPHKQQSFRRAINMWAVEHNICDRNKKVWRFQAHQFRHTVGMRLLNNDVPLDVISRLLGHHSLTMTQVYASVRGARLREVLERATLKRRTVDYRGQVVKGDERANDPDAQLLRKGIRGQTLPVGGCGRLVVRGPCDHANKCVTCPFWLTSTDDAPALQEFYTRAVRLRQRAEQTGNQIVLAQQDHLIPYLATRIKSMEDRGVDGSLSVDDVLEQLRTDLAEAESAKEEVRTNGFVLATKHLERTIIELKAKITALEGAK